MSARFERDEWVDGVAARTAPYLVGVVVAGAAWVTIHYLTARNVIGSERAL